MHAVLPLLLRLLLMHACMLLLQCMQHLLLLLRLLLLMHAC